MHHPTPLPIDWVVKLFRKLSARYGKTFLGQYEGAPIEDVQLDWAQELGGLQGRPEAIAHALNNLPERAPNVAQFRQLCINAPRAAVALPPVPADPQRVQAEVAKLNQPHAGYNVYTDWIRRGLSDLEAGMKRSATVEKMIRDAAKTKGIAA